ncbi:hypothetical protein GCM10009117_06140 [Gangjinia marincola]|uniref:Uncharacterized protein n=1 Tax=Gangjinia marincola TaxID=578463 RepID=A0ABN1MEB1_9FLAO
MSNTQRIFLFFLFSILFSLKGKAQCAMCRAVLESEENQGVAEGINDGIMYLMVWPYILVGIVGYIVYRMYRSRTVEEE